MWVWIFLEAVFKYWLSFPYMISLGALSALRERFCTLAKNTVISLLHKCSLLLLHNLRPSTGNYGNLSKLLDSKILMYDFASLDVPLYLVIFWPFEFLLPVFKERIDSSVVPFCFSWEAGGQYILTSDLSGCKILLIFLLDTCNLLQGTSFQGHLSPAFR